MLQDGAASQNQPDSTDHLAGTTGGGLVFSQERGNAQKCCVRLSNCDQQSEETVLWLGALKHFPKSLHQEFAFKWQTLANACSGVKRSDAG